MLSQRKVDFTFIILFCISLNTISYEIDVTTTFCSIKMHLHWPIRLKWMNVFGRCRKVLSDANKVNSCVDIKCDELSKLDQDASVRCALMAFTFKQGIIDTTHRAAAVYTEPSGAANAATVPRRWRLLLIYINWFLWDLGHRPEVSSWMRTLTLVQIYTAGDISSLR